MHTKYVLLYSPTLTQLFSDTMLPPLLSFMSFFFFNNPMSLICAAHISMGMGPYGHDQPTRDLTFKENQLSLPESHPCQSFPTCG